MKKLIKEIAKREGKKSQVHIGNIREILSHLTDILSEYRFDGKSHAELVEEVNACVLKKDTKLKKKKKLK